jgi:hypothetical protein
MRTTLATLAMTVLWTIPGFGQTDKTFYFTQPASPADITAMTTMVRTVADLQDITTDEKRLSMSTRGPIEKLVLADWLFHQVDRPGGPAAEYKLTGEKEEVVRIFRVSPTATNPDITALTTAIRTVCDLQRLFPYASRQAIVGRGAPDKIAAADWIVRQLLPPDGQAPTADSTAFPAPTTDSMTPDVKSVIQIFRMDPKTTNAQLTSTVTAIRSVADIQRLFPFESGMAIVARDTPAKVAVAEWLVHELANPADAGAVRQTTMPGLMDGVVRLFYVGKGVDVTPLVTQIRSTLDIRRMFPFSQPAAVVLRGRPDQMPAVEAMVAKFVADAR